MIAPRLTSLAALAFVPFIGSGCGVPTPADNPPGTSAGASAGQVPNAVNPVDVLKPGGPDAPTPEATAPEVRPVDLAAGAPDPGPEVGEVTLVPMSFERFRQEVATNPKAKYTLVDVWATWCGPCKQNFPHLVEMHRKYADRGLAVASLALELEPTDAATIEEAKAFLKEQGAHFPNVVFAGEAQDGFEKLGINGIPAVFLFRPDGQELKRFTMDDPDNQFTYDQVEREVVALLGGEAPEAEAPAEGSSD